MIDKKCPICREVFTVPYPELWRYRKGSYESVKTTWFCSWGCLRKYEQQKEDKKMRQKVTLKQKEQAVQIAIDGGDPIAFLDGFGVDGAQMWLAIRRKLRETKPEVFSQLPEGMQLGQSKKAITEEPKQEEPQEEVIGSVTIEPSEMMREAIRKAREEQPGIFEPLRYEGMTVTGVTGEFGEYRMVVNNGGQWIDYRNQSRIVLTVDDWREWLKELKHAARILGVELETEKTR